MDPWREIGRPEDSETVAVRRIDAEHPLDLYRGRDYDGKIFFRFIGKFEIGKETTLPSLASIDVAVEKIDAAKSQLTLSLISGGDENIFRALCANLAEATINVPPDDHQTAVSVLLARLERWRNLLKLRRDGLLDRSQQLGLFGELMILRDVFMDNLSTKNSLLAWRGPVSDEQDFCFGNWLIEIKSQMSSADKKIHISSQDQLDPVSGEIILCHQTFGSSSETESSARTLSGLVTELRTLISDHDTYALDIYEGNLIETGYVDNAIYCKDHLLLGQRLYFQVVDEFPRLVAADIPAGIEDIRYSIRIDECMSWMIEEKITLEKVFN
jgi:hypothetical protein